MINKVVVVEIVEVAEVIVGLLRSYLEFRNEQVTTCKIKGAV